MFFFSSANIALIARGVGGGGWLERTKTYDSCRDAVHVSGWRGGARETLCPASSWMAAPARARLCAFFVCVCRYKIMLFVCLFFNK